MSSTTLPTLPALDNSFLEDLEGLLEREIRFSSPGSARTSMLISEDALAEVMATVEQILSPRTAALIAEKEREQEERRLRALEEVDRQSARRKLAASNSGVRSTPPVSARQSME